MKYLTYNIKQGANNKPQAGKSRSAPEAGVTLLLAVFVMSSITIIAVTVGFLAIREIRSSRSLILVDPAQGAANAGAEEGLWAIKRVPASLPYCPGTFTAMGNNSVRNQCRSTSGPVSFDLQAGVAHSPIYLYDPNNINGDVDLRGMLPSWYTTLTVTNKAGLFTASVFLTRLDGTPIGPQPLVVSPGATQTINGLAGPAGADNRMRIVMQSAGNSTLEVSTDQGIPDFATVDSLGCNSAGRIVDCSSSSQDTYARRLHVTVPISQ